MTTLKTRFLFLWQIDVACDQVLANRMSETWSGETCHHILPSSTPVPRGEGGKEPRRTVRIRIHSKDGVATGDISWVSGNPVELLSSNFYVREKWNAILCQTLLFWVHGISSWSYVLILSVNGLFLHARLQMSWESHSSDNFMFLLF